MTRFGMVLSLPLAIWLTSCAIDTELGLEATINASAVTVASDNVVTTGIDMTYRVGEHATGERVFQPQSIELFVGDALVATMVPNAPPGFVSRVSPGESFSVTFSADDNAAADPRRLCGAEVRVLFRWLDTSMSEIGMTEATTSDVACE